MTNKTALLRANPIARHARKYLRSRRGNIAPMVALLIVPLVTLLGLATQGGSWFLMNRAMQNAADSAVIAAATDGSNGGTDYVANARSVTANYGFTNGSNNVTVYVPAPTTYSAVTACASSPCYNVAINAVAPLYLLQLIGFTGNATTSGGGTGQTVTAGALATTIQIKQPICLLGLSSSGDAIATDGSPAANLPCNIQSNSGSSCNGHAITTGFSDSVGTQDGSKNCGLHVNNSQPAVSDPYATSAMSTSIANAVATANVNNCPSTPTYYPESSTNWPSGTNKLSSNMTLQAVTVFCGDVSLGANVQVTTPSTGSVIIIENGMLDLNNFQLQSTAGSGLAIIFYSPQGSAEAYTGGGTPTNFVCGTPGCGPGSAQNAILDISSPTMGTFSGIALLQDPNLPLQGSATKCTGNDPWTYSGNSPTWNISGVVDLDRTNFCVSGNIGQATNGFACLTIVDNSTQVNGTGNIFYQNPQSQCAQQGVSQIEAIAYKIGQLVY